MVDHPDELVCVAAFSEPTAAWLLHESLRAGGVPAVVDSETINRMLNTIVGPSDQFPVRVLVFRRDLDRALSVVREHSAPPDLTLPAWTCACGAEVDEGFCCCWSCGADYPLDGQ